MPQNNTVVLSVNSQTLGDKFMMHNPANVRKHPQHACGCAPDMTHILLPWRLGAFHYEDEAVLSLVFGL